MMMPELLMTFLTQKSIQRLTLGSTLDEVSTCLGEPDNTAILGRKNKTLIQKYEQVEFYFENSTCTMIQFIFYDPKNEPIFENTVMRFLLSKGIEYRVIPDLTSADQTCYLTSNQIYIISAIDEGGAIKKVYIK